jgi:hypothetical protein
MFALHLLKLATKLRTPNTTFKNVGIGLTRLITAVTSVKNATLHQLLNPGVKNVILNFATKCLTFAMK